MLDPLSLAIPLGSTSAKPKNKLPQRKLLSPSPEHPDDYILEVDYSSISKFMECPRMSENYLIHGREAQREQVATAFGRLFHQLEEMRLANGLTPEVVTAQQEAIALHFLENPSPPGEYRTGDRMLNVIKQYNMMYGNDRWPEKVLKVEGEPFVERPFKIPLMTVEVNTTFAWIDFSQLIDFTTMKAGPHKTTVPVRNLHILYVGKIDAVLEDGNLIWVPDHKTSSRGGREFEEAFRLSLQTRGYVWAAQKIVNKPITGLIMNAIICRPLTRTGTGTEFNRHNYFYSQDSLLEFEDNMKAIISDFVGMLQRGYFPQHSRSFKSPCSSCDYSENCPLPRSQRPADLASELYRDVTWSPIHS